MWMRPSMSTSPRNARVSHGRAWQFTTFEDAGEPVEGGSIAVYASEGARVNVALTNVAAYTQVGEYQGRGDGGFLYARASESSSIDVVVSNGTFQSSTRSGHGGVFAAKAEGEGSVAIELRNSILWGSQAPAGGVDCWLEKAVLHSNGHNMFSERESCVWGDGDGSYGD